MVFAPTAASVGWEVRSDVVHPSQDDKNKSSESRCKKSIGQNELREKKLKKKNNNDFPIKQSKKKRIVDKTLEGLVAFHPIERDYNLTSKKDMNYRGFSANNFDSPGVAITEQNNGREYSVILTFSNISEKDSLDLQHGSPSTQSIGITGTAIVSAIEGKFDILGFTLTSKFDLALNSPSWMSSLCISSCETHTHLNLKKSDKASGNGISHSRIQSKVRITSTSENRTFQLSTHENMRTQISISERWASTAASILNDVTKYLSELFSKGIEYHAEGHGLLSDSIVNPNFSELEDMHEHLDECANKNTKKRTYHTERILICGAKGVGKSTYLRYLVNRFLSTEKNGVESGHNEVAILDCDAGQPEFSPPGLLSLTIVNKPILSPPDAHLVYGCGKRKTQSSATPHKNSLKEERLFAVADNHYTYYYGYTSSKADPTSYISIVKRLIAYFENMNFEQSTNAQTECCSRQRRIPLIVSTDGWIKGMGYEILSSIIDVIEPKHIVQILGFSKSKTFDLTPYDSDSRRIYKVEAYGNHNINFLSRNVSLNADTLATFSVQSRNVTDNYSPYTDIACQDFNSQVTSLSLRNLRLCSYFLGNSSSFLKTGATFQSNIVDIENKIAQQLARCRPFVVPYDEVKCIHPDLNESGNVDDIIDSFNCSVVGLCLGKSDYEIFYPCVGLGIIRGIDRRKRLFYILTPVPASEVIYVENIVYGNIQLPLECVFLGLKAESFSFQCCDRISNGIGGDIIKSSSNVIKK